MFEFGLPWYFLLLPLPILFRWVMPPKELKSNTALKVPFFHHMKHLSAYQKVGQKRVSTCLLWLIWATLIISISDPKWVGEATPIEREGRNIFLGLDLSLSMQAMDFSINQRPVTRLAIVKYAAKQFVKARTQDRLGLILFGSRAYLQTPLTFDHKTILHMLDDATPGLAGETTAIGDAIAQSVKHLKKTPLNSRVLILLTDGVNNSGNIEPMAAAEIAKRNHIKIYTIGLGAGGFGIYQQDLDEKTLKQIAHITEGEYYLAKNLDQLNQIYQKINMLELSNSKAESFRPEEHYYFLPLAFAFVCLLLLGLSTSHMFRRVTL